MPAAVDQRPYLVEGLPVNNRLVGALYYHPVPAVLFDALFAFIIDFPCTALHHTPDVSLVLQHIGNALTAPQASVGARICHRQTGIGGGSRYALCIQLSGNFSATHAIQSHSKNPPHHRGCVLVDDNFVLFCRVHLIAVDWLASDEQTFPLLVMLDAGNLFRDVLGVHIIHDSAERCNVVGGGVHPSVNAVQQGDVADPVLREVTLHVVAGEDVVAAQSAQILGDDHVDLPGLNVGDHALEIRTVEICTAPTVVDIGVENGQAVLLDKFIEQGLLVVDAFGRTFIFILLR